MGTLPEDADLVLTLRDSIGAGSLVETGTFRGDSTAWAAQHFLSVDTIDISTADHARAREQSARFGNVHFYIGDSRTCLPPLVRALAGPAVFWLDGHNADHLFGPGDDDCPVLEELACIFASPHGHVVLIDDAHTFAEPPIYRNWITLAAIAALAERNGYSVEQVRDVLVLCRAKVSTGC